MDYYMPKILASDVLGRLGLQAGKYFLVSTHREENVDVPENLRDLLDTLSGLAEAYGYPVIVSTHPRTQKRLDALDGGATNPLIQFAKPFGFFDYNKLQIESACVVSDSGTITEEASLLNLPAITIRNAHERPEGMDVGTLIMSGLKRENVLEAVKVVIDQHVRGTASARPVQDYEATNVAQQVLRIVMSYTDYVNRTVWHKSH
jgi:UDP-N-acetylglucosamine 2-epimerase (non-hydrolysing)